MGARFGRTTAFEVSGTLYFDAEHLEPLVYGSHYLDVRQLSAGLLRPV